MRIPTEGKLLRIFIGEADKWHGKPWLRKLYNWQGGRGWQVPLW